MPSVAAAGAAAAPVSSVSSTKETRRSNHGASIGNTAGSRLRLRWNTAGGTVPISQENEPILILVLIPQGIRVNPNCKKY